MRLNKNFSRAGFSNRQEGEMKRVRRTACIDNGRLHLTSYRRVHVLRLRLGRFRDDHLELVREQGRATRTQLVRRPARLILPSGIVRPTAIKSSKLMGKVGTVGSSTFAASSRFACARTS